MAKQAYVLVNGTWETIGGPVPNIVQPEPPDPAGLAEGTLWTDSDSTGEGASGGGNMEFKGDWDDVTLYRKGSVVIYKGKQWVAMSDYNEYGTPVPGKVGAPTPSGVVGSNLFANAPVVTIKTPDSGNPSIWVSPDFNNATYTNEVNEPPIMEPGGWTHTANKSAWWKYTPIVSKTMTFHSNNDGTGDTVMSLYSVPAGVTSPTFADLIRVTGNDDTDIGSGAYSELPDVPVTAGTTYYIQLGAYSSSSTFDYRLNLTGTTGPAPTTPDIEITFKPWGYLGISHYDVPGSMVYNFRNTSRPSTATPAPGEFFLTSDDPYKVVFSPYDFYGRNATLFWDSVCDQSVSDIVNFSWGPDWDNGGDSRMQVSSVYIQVNGDAAADKITITAGGWGTRPNPYDDNILTTVERSLSVGYHPQGLWYGGQGYNTLQNVVLPLYPGAAHFIGPNVSKNLMAITHIVFDRYDWSGKEGFAHDLRAGDRIVSFLGSYNGPKRLIVRVTGGPDYSIGDSRTQTIPVAYVYSDFPSNENAYPGQMWWFPGPEPVTGFFRGSFSKTGIVSNTVTPVTFISGTMDSGVSPSGGNIAIQKTGFWTVGVSGWFDNLVGGTGGYVEIMTGNAYQWRDIQGANGQYFNVTAHKYLSAGEVVNVNIYQTGGGNRNFNGSFDMRWVGE